LWVCSFRVEDNPDICSHGFVPETIAGTTHI
jgi:hypothetical protein